MSKIVEVTATIRLKISDKLSEELAQSDSNHDFVLRNCFRNNARVVLDANVVEIEDCDRCGNDAPLSDPVFWEGRYPTSDEKELLCYSCIMEEDTKRKEKT